VSSEHVDIQNIVTTLLRFLTGLLQPYQGVRDARGAFTVSNQQPNEEVDAFFCRVDQGKVKMKRKGLGVMGITAFMAMNASAIWINEFHYDNSGGDVDEFVEIAGAAGVEVSGWTLHLYNGSNGESYKTEALTGTIDDEGAGYGALFIPINGIQNGSPDGIALVDESDVVMEFLSYEGAFLATDGPASGTTSTDIGVSEPTSTVVGASLQLVGDFDTGFSWTGPIDDSPGLLNIGQTFPQEEPPSLPDKPATVPDGGATAALLFGGLTALSLLHRRIKMP